MNRKLCLYHKRKKTFKREMCGICNRYNTCISRKEDEFKFDERREMIHASDDMARDHIGKP